MSKNTFTKNHAGSQAVPGVGGAFAAYDYVTVRDTGSRFSHNRAFGNGAFGGGVAMYSTFMSSSWTKSRFTGNSAGNNVGTNEGFGGAVYSSNTDGDAFTQVTMDGNTAASAGGGYYGDGDAGQTSFQASTLSNNTAGTSGHEGTGGGLFADNSVIVVANSTLTGNKAASISGASGQGGAIWGGGYRLAVRYSTVSGNYAKVAAGIYSNIYSSVLSSIVSENKTSRSGSERDCGRSDPAYELKSLGGVARAVVEGLLDAQHGRRDTPGRLRQDHPLHVVRRDLVVADDEPVRTEVPGPGDGDLAVDQPVVDAQVADGHARLASESKGLYHCGLDHTLRRPDPVSRGLT
jgi:hypothetical protein